MQGSVEIQSYCLGHTYFVSSATWVAAPGGSEPLLVTGSGDGTVRLWDPVAGALLDTLTVSKAEEPEEAGATAGASSGAAAEEAAAAAEEGAEEAVGGSTSGAAGAGGEGGGGEEEQGEEGEGGEEEDDGEEREPNLQDKVAMGPKCAPVICVASHSDG